MLLAAVLPALLAASCGGAGEPGDVAGGGALAEAELGLSTAPLDQAPVPPRWSANETMPGEEPIRSRPYAGAPPVIPHALAAFLPLTNEENNCLLCHQAGGEKVEGEPTPLPSSHLVDLRRAPGEARHTVAGARHNCLACHVPRTDAPLLVENLFAPPGGAPPGEAAGGRSP